MLKIFNTLTRKKEEFKSILSGIVSIYVCGVTVYDFCHIGHARTFIFFDFVVRYLRYSGYIVNYVRNITDIDDKIIQRSIQNKEPYQKLTNRMILAMHSDFKILNILPPTHEPRVTEYMNVIIDSISRLIERDYAYVALNGDVFFSIENRKNYNILSRQNFDKLYIMNCSNIKIKRHPMDFVLWKKCDHDPMMVNKMSWFSPWGWGRPGWHIECSAISYSIFGKCFDIHGGGSDLIFPHHENEIAQSSSLDNTFYINVWMHVGMVMCNALKMSKSLNNFFTIRNILEIYDPETIRYFLLSSHYRSSINYTHDNLRRARISLEHLYISLQDINRDIDSGIEKYFVSKFVTEINNDFNTPAAYSVLFEIAHSINRLKRKNKITMELQCLASTLRYLGGLLGLLNQDSKIFLQGSNISNINNNQNIVKIVELLIKDRNIARKNHEWMLADEIRRKLFTLGVKLEDSSHGTTWRFIN